MKGKNHHTSKLEPCAVWHCYSLKVRLNIPKLIYILLIVKSNRPTKCFKTCHLTFLIIMLQNSSSSYSHTVRMCLSFTMWQLSLTFNMLPVMYKWQLCVPLELRASSFSTYTAVIMYNDSNTCSIALSLYSNKLDLPMRLYINFKLSFEGVSIHNRNR